MTFFLTLFLAGTSMAQTCSISGPPGGAEEDLLLDGTGLAVIDYLWLNSAAGIVINGCSPFVRRYRVYDGPTIVATIFPLTGGINFDCTAGSQGAGDYNYTVFADNNNNVADGQIGPISLIVHVKDTDPPSINALGGAPFSGMTSDDGTGNCTTTITGLTHPTVNDNCASPMLTVEYFNGSTSISGPTTVVAGGPNTFLFPGGTTNARYIATDASGNPSTQYSFDVTVTDDENPAWNNMASTVGMNLGTHAILKNSTDANGRRNFHIGLECSSTSLTMDLTYLLNTFAPTASDNCMGSVTVTEQNRTDNTFLTCGTVNSYTNVMREVIIRFEGSDPAGNNLNAAAPDGRFVLKIYVRDNVAPAWADNTPYAFGAQTGPNYTFTQTYNTNASWNPTASANVCAVDFSNAMAPDLSVMASECTGGSTTYAWTITPSVPVTTPTMLTGTTQDAFVEPFEVGTYTVSYTATDFCGNNSTYQINLTIADNSGPAITGLITGPLTGNTTPGNCEGTVQWTNPVATDCSGPIPVLVTAQGIHTASMTTVLIDLNAGPDGSGGILAQADFPVGATVVTYTFTDALGNTSTEDFTVNITDNQAPTISCGGPVILPTVCGASTIPDYTGNGTASDNCPASLTIVQSPLPNASVTLQNIIDDFTTNGSVAPYFYQDNDTDNMLSDGDQFTISLTPNDGTANGTPCNIVVTLQNNAAPIPNTSPLPTIDQTYYVGAGCGSVDVPAPTAKDCNGNTFYGTPGSANGNPSPNVYTFNTGFYTVTWTYFDGVNSSTQIQNITVVDDSQTPSLEIPVDVTVNTDPGICTHNMNFGLTDVTTGPLTTGPYNPVVLIGQYKDNCGISSATYELSGATNFGPATITPTTSFNFNKGVTMITYTINDGTTAPVIKTRSITVQDKEDPVPTTSNQFLNILASGLPDDNILDDCSYSVNSTVHDPSAVDNCDMTGASITKKVVSIVPHSTTPNVTTTLAIGATTYNGASFTPSSLDGGFGLFQIFWEFEDVDGNDITQFQWVNVSDDQNPTFDCVADEDGNALNGIQVERGTGDDGLFGDCNYTVQGTEFDLSNVFDNCEIDTVMNSLTGAPTLDGYVFSQGPHSFSWTVRDIRGNNSSCIVNVEISDNEEPTFSCISGQVFTLNSSGTVSITPAQLINPFSWSDNCPGAAFQNPTISQSTFTCSDTGNDIDVTVTYEDANGNMNSCIASVTIQENIPPVAVCADITIQLDAAGDASIVASDLDGGSSDACGQAVTLVAMQTSFDCDDLGTNGVILTVTDNQNNSATCTSQVTVEDNIAPVAMCQPVTAYLDASGNAVITAAQVDNGSSDNTDACWAVDLSISGTAIGGFGPDMSFTCSSNASVDVWLQVEDHQGLIDQCMTTITVVDTIKPTALCQNQTYRLTAAGTVEVFAVNLDGGSSDNCGSPLGFNIGGDASVMMDCFNIGLNDVELTVVDQNGNTQTCTAVVEILPELDVDLEIGMVTGGAGQIIDVPVTISNGLDVRSFQFTLEIDDNTVGVIDGFSSTLSSSDYTTNQIGNNKFAFAWSPLGTTGTDFNDGDTVLILQVELVGLDNEMSDVNFVASPTPLVVSQGCGVLPYGTTVSSNNGNVFIDPNTTVTIGGTIYSEDGDLQDNVLVTMSGDENGTTTTDAFGDYSFTIPNNSTVTITPTSDTTPIKGVDAVDLATMVSHFINGGGVITSPYDLIGGNVDESGLAGIQIADVGKSRGEIVSLTPTWQPLNSFRYVSTDYTFTDATAPWNEAFEESRLLVASSNDSGLDFVSVKMGDVNSSWEPLIGNDDPSNRSAGTILSVEDVVLVTGETSTLKFTANDFDNLIAFQSTFSFDVEAFDIIDAKTMNLDNFTDEMISLQYADQGLATIIWYNHYAVTMDPTAVLFELTIRAKKDINSLEGLIDFSEEIVTPTVYDNSEEALGFDLEIIKSTVNTIDLNIDQFELFQNNPNPFVNTTNISFSLPETQYARLSISDATGRVIWQKDGTFNKGLNQFMLSSNELPNAGVLLIELQSEGTSKTKRMILLNN